MNWQAFFLCCFFFLCLCERKYLDAYSWLGTLKSAFLTNNAKSHSWRLPSWLSSKCITCVSWFSQPLEVGWLLSRSYTWEVIEESGPQILSCEGSHPLRLAPEVRSPLHKVSPFPSVPSWSPPPFVDCQYFQAFSSSHKPLFITQSGYAGL